ncbi:hypothetical protein [Actinoplanes utahensis]|uniref:Uncharacterized protein n=1 Tax=Actinoplanes utahensis TaxID=1869 RepID=A0A0A6XEA2_ACTUT|nr:hypothetical protein [Actinoplanes utahensis]KHD78417.1 hypothetical protein MB27_04090 [Actinoplanes utahensis]GIF31941.1 hypothetical protein Aut01nite_49270 [Actinoplanes utahensis]
MRLLSLILLFVLTAAVPARAVESAPRPTPAFNGTVHAVAYLGGTVYVGGAFTKVGWGGRTHPRERLAAFDGRTGELLSWAPPADGTVRALAAVPGAVYAAGDFHRIAGQKRDALARINPLTGTVATFQHGIAGTPYALAAGNGRLYLGGSLTAVGGRPVRNVAAFSLATGALDTGWQAGADDRVHTLALAGEDVLLGGAFKTVNADRLAVRLAAVHATTGVLDRYFRPKVAAEVNAIAVDSLGVYVATGGQGGRAIAYTFDGSTRWQRVFDGDTTAITTVGGVAYIGGHFDRVCLTARNGPQGACLDGSVPRVKLAAVTGDGRLTDWNPQANGVIGVRVLTTDPATGSLDAGGDFTTIGGRLRPRFARF